MISSQKLSQSLSLLSVSVKTQLHNPISLPSHHFHTCNHKELFCSFILLSSKVEMAYLPKVQLYGISVPNVKHGILLFGSQEFATGETNGTHADNTSLSQLSLLDIMNKLNVGYYLDGKLIVNKRLNVKFINYEGELYLTLKGTESEAKFIY